VAQRVGRVIALLFHDLGARQGVSGQQHAPAALYPRERPGTPCTGGWVGPRAGMDRRGKSRPSSGFDPRTVQPVAQSLYRPSYRPTIARDKTKKVAEDVRSFVSIVTPSAAKKKPPFSHAILTIQLAVVTSVKTIATICIINGIYTTTSYRRSAGIWSLSAIFEEVLPHAWITCFLPSAR
jgi:hypothetical protein